MNQDKSATVFAQISDMGLLTVLFAIDRWNVLVTLINYLLKQNVLGFLIKKNIYSSVSQKEF